ncbi:MAG: poly(3-hydroxybutyrate) depolymerase [Chitinophagaceae bacterium]|nr:poly(3-hydroxybutyrate) depolymerase [Chitinophagaceae bacterium]
MRRILILIHTAFTSSLALAQLVDDSIAIEGNYRTFHFREPRVQPNAALVFVLHGSGGDGKGIMQTSKRLEEAAQKENILIVYPDGYKHFWNECRKMAETPPNKENINEEAFFTAMIDYFTTKYKTGPEKVFVIGTSGGGHMAYKLAMNIPAKIRAITAIVANLPDSANMDCTPSGKPIAVMIVNGTEDEVNPYGGGLVRAANVSLGTVRSTDQTFVYWSAVAGYKGQPVKKAYADTDPSDGKTIEGYTYKKARKPEITLLKVVGGKHDYPGDIDVYLEAWAFFKRQLSTR